MCTCTGIAATPDVVLVDEVPEGRPARPRVVLGRAGEVRDSADHAAKVSNVYIHMKEYASDQSRILVADLS